ncbi:LOW QUALITY PROTEIN: hypothetical protein NC652_038567 [Populus alba x Populus x berolinensis]|nr:LOW QUALITY PROTEIN: hypothetical protein NC652_038567 [Populus alba x Populus x berolinensis]
MTNIVLIFGFLSVDLLEFIFLMLCGVLIKSMKRENLVLLATFASVFSSYVIVDSVKEAIMTFEVMGQFGCTRHFLHVAKNRFLPDADSICDYLLEGGKRK